MEEAAAVQRVFEMREVAEELVGVEPLEQSSWLIRIRRMRVWILAAGEASSNSRPTG